MAEHDISLVTAKAGSVVLENLKPSLATPAGALTPATLTAMAGLAKGGALQIAPIIGTTISGLQAKAALYGNVLSPSYNPTLAANLALAATNLSTQSQQLLPAGNPAAFGQVVMQAQGHIADALEIKSATSFIANTSYGDYGSGISSVSSMATQGIDKVLGDLPSAAKAFTAAGPAFDLKDMNNFGSSAGLVNKISSLKLGNASGLNAELTKAGVDITQMHDPVYASSIDKVLNSITDPKIISTITNQMGIVPPVGKTIYASIGSMGSDIAPVVGIGGVQSLKDLTDIKKLSNPADVAGMSTDLKGVATKLGDMGAKFDSPAAAASMLNGITIPSVPKLDAFAPSLGGLMGDLKGDIDGMTGLGNGAHGLPNMTDFTQAAAGGPTIDAMAAALASGSESAITSAVAGVHSMISTTSSLLNKAGVDLTTPTPPSLGSIKSFGMGLHPLGADANGSGVTDVLHNMATDDAHGEAIKASLAEGKNKLLMQAHGIAPLQFTPTSNPFSGLPGAAGDNSLSGGSTLLGGS